MLYTFLCVAIRLAYNTALMIRAFLQFPNILRLQFCGYLGEIVLESVSGI